MLAAIFWFIGYGVFGLFAGLLPHNFYRPRNEWERMDRGEPGITSYFATIYWWSGVCAFLFLGTLVGIHPAIYWFHGICIFLFVCIRARENYKKIKKEKENRLRKTLEAQRKEKLDAVTKGCTKRKIRWGFIGTIGYSTAGLMERARENPTHWGWYFQDGPRPSSHECIAFQGPEGLIPTEKQLKIAEHKRNRKRSRGQSVSSRVHFTVEELQKEERKYDAMIRREKKIEENKEVFT